jgi:DNA polymerase-3 subunit gamma/tau
VANGVASILNLSKRMTYLVLARKYRPKNFSEVVGQSHVLKALIHALSHNKLHHAYLFTGTRGVGKTSLARILAKSLNCEKGLSATPCDECGSCIEISQGRHIDVLEIDAASRTKVEDTRDLLDNIQYMPQKSKYKIYIIDEVHMLSGHSFNALLKTLEEPPSHVKFLLATTDPQKLPVTVLSRCLQFHLRNISIEQITQQLETILNKENITYEKTALIHIAKNAQGSMRDALSLLDQCIAHGEGNIVEKNVCEVLGSTSEEEIITLLQLVHEKNTEKLLEKIQSLDESGSDFFTIIDDLLSYLQKLAVAQSPDFKTEDIQLYYQILLLGKRDLPLAPDPKSGFIMILMRMIAFIPATHTEKKTEKSKPNEIKLQEIKTQEIKLEKTKPDKINPNEINSEEIKPNETLVKNNKGNINWREIVSQLNLSGAAELLANNCVLNILEEEKIELQVGSSHGALLTPSAKIRLTEALQGYFKKSCQIIINVGKSLTETPFEQKTRESSEKINEAKATLLADKKVQYLMKTFSATLVNDSIDIDTGDKR